MFPSKLIAAPPYRVMSYHGLSLQPVAGLSILVHDGVPVAGVAGLGGGAVSVSCLGIHMLG